MSIRKHRLLIAAAVFIMAAPAAHAQFAVIDVAAVTQLLTEVQNLEQALNVAREHLAEAQAQLRSMTGDRGMEQLLAGTNRNYLPQSSRPSRKMRCSRRSRSARSLRARSSS